MNALVLATTTLRKLMIGLRPSSRAVLKSEVPFLALLYAERLFGFRSSFYLRHWYSGGGDCCFAFVCVECVGWCRDIAALISRLSLSLSFSVFVSSLEMLLLSVTGHTRLFMSFC